MSEDCKWLSWIIFEQVKIEINLRKINQTATMRTFVINRQDFHLYTRKQVSDSIEHHCHIQQTMHVFK